MGMALDLYVQRKGSLLVPVTKSDQIEIERLPHHRVLSAHINLQDAPKIQRYYRAAVQLLTESVGRWPNREIAHHEIMMRAGYFDSFVISANGDVRYTPQSTIGWDEVQWKEFLMRAMPILLEFAGESRAQFRDRVDKFFGMKLREAWEP